ncbi:MAG TPA: hypothetical protein VNE41_04030 [Chitinophagaceae bacterium]|nr:hypothetical protein [Chitinophagaceae bacterium]
MKKYFLILGAMITGVIGLHAQGNFMQMTPQERADNMTTRMQKQITGLTGDQVSQLKTINLDFSQKMDSMFQASSGDRSAMRGNFRILNSSRDSTLKTVLTNDQFTQWQDYQTKMRARMRNRGGGGGNN